MVCPRCEEWSASHCVFPWLLCVPQLDVLLHMSRHTLVGCAFWAVQVPVRSVQPLMYGASAMCPAGSMGNIRSAWDERDDEIESGGEGGGDEATEGGQSAPVGASTQGVSHVS